MIEPILDQEYIKYKVKQLCYQSNTLYSIADAVFDFTNIDNPKQNDSFDEDMIVFNVCQNAPSIYEYELQPGDCYLELNNIQSQYNLPIIDPILFKFQQATPSYIAKQSDPTDIMRINQKDDHTEVTSFSSDNSVYYSHIKITESIFDKDILLRALLVRQSYLITNRRNTQRIIIAPNIINNANEVEAFIVNLVESCSKFLYIKKKYPQYITNDMSFQFVIIVPEQKILEINEQYYFLINFNKYNTNIFNTLKQYQFQQNWSFNLTRDDIYNIPDLLIQLYIVNRHFYHYHKYNIDPFVDFKIFPGFMITKKQFDDYIAKIV